VNLNTNFLEELQNLDVNEIGRWPLVFRAIFVALAFVVATSGGYYYFVFEQKMPVLERAESEEADLKRDFEAKQRKAANLDAYKEQLADIERSFGTMLQQLPGKTEIPNLLVDISQTGLAAGLDEKLFKPESEVRKGFYAEKPIRIVLNGTYHEFGNFVSDIAALPRIVTLHDIDISPLAGNDADGELVLSVLAKTYRYLDENEASE
jgi:type IV pilus assembly protein PilO